MPKVGIAPTTSCFSGKRSTLLSYLGKHYHFLFRLVVTSILPVTSGFATTIVFTSTPDSHSGCRQVSHVRHPVKLNTTNKRNFLTFRPPWRGVVILPNNQGHNQDEKDHYRPAAKFANLEAFVSHSCESRRWCNPLTMPGFPGPAWSRLMRIKSPARLSGFRGN